MPTAKTSEEIPVGGVLNPKYLWITLGLFSLIFLAAFESMAVTTVMPVISADLDGQSLYALAFAGPLAVGVVGMVVAGNWSDRSGPRMPLIALVVAFTVGLLIAGTAENMWVFVAGRLVQGVGAGGVIVPTYVLVARVYPPILRPRIFAGFAAAWVVPSLVGPFFAGLVADLLSWHWVFLGVVGLILIAVVMVVPALRHPAVGGPVGGTIPPWSILSMGCAVLVAVAVLGLNVSAELPQPIPWIIAAFALVLVGFAARPLLPKRTLRAGRGLPSVMVVRGLLGGSFLAAEVYIPLLLTGPNYGLSAALAGVALTGSALAWSAASWAQGRITRLSHGTIITVGSVVTVLGMVFAFVATLAVAHPAIMFVAWTVAGLGMGLLYPRLSVAMLELSAESEQGFNSSALSIADSTGAATQIALTALVFAVLAPFGLLWQVAGCFVFTGAAGLLGAVVARRIDASAANTLAIGADPI